MTPRMHFPNIGFANRHSAGFTLMELVISIVLVGILAVSSVSVIKDGFTTSRMVEDTQFGEGEARYAIERLAREIRETKVLSSGAYCITMTSATSLSFNKRTVADNSNIDTSSCSTNTDTYAISYSSPNLTLTYTPNGGSATSRTLSTRVTSFSMTYYGLNSDNTLLSSPTTSTVRFVLINVTTTDPTGGQSISQRTRVALRNG